MFDFDKYFLAQCNVYLHHLDYDMQSLNGEPRFTITDSIQAYELNEDKVRFELSRSVSAPTGQLFSMKAVFGAIYTKNAFVKDEVDWSTVDLVKEFKTHKKPFINNVYSRLALLIANVTSSSGVIPLITPPNIIAPQ